MTVSMTKDSIDLGIVTTNLEPMLTFYRDTLGLVPDGEMDIGGGSRMTRLKCGTTVIKLVVHGKEPAATAAPGGIQGATGYRYWTISVANLKEVTEECDKAGYKIAVPPTEIRTGITISMIEDPDGNWVELLQMD